MHKRLVLALSTFAVVLLLRPVGAVAAPVLQLYGTIHAMGVIVTLAATDDPAQRAAASVEYRESGMAGWRAGFPLSRVNMQRFVGSLFSLQPGTTYEVRVRFDAATGPLGGRTVATSGATRAEPTIPEAADSLYVSPAGSGTACSEQAPCPLRVAIDRARAGDHVLLGGGVYYEGEMALARSGSATAPVVIRSRAGERAILDGADPAPFKWTAQGGGVYRTTLGAPDPRMVVAGGARLFRYRSLDDLRALRAGVAGFFVSSGALYVRLPGNANPDSVRMAVSRYHHAFDVERSFIYFVDLTFRYYGHGEYAKAIYLHDASDNLVHGCTFEWNDIGVGIKYASSRNVIEESEFHDSIGHWPWDEVKESDYTLEDGGVYVYETVTGRGNVIRRNVFHDDFDGFHVSPANSAAITNETDVYENLVYNMADDGMEVDGRASNVRIWGNTFHDVLMGISMAPVIGGPVYAIRNVIFRIGAGGRDGSAFKFNSDEGRSGPMYLFHNTADAAEPGQNALYLMEPGSWPLLYARNNVWAGTRFAVANENPRQKVDLDYDDLYTSEPGSLVWWDGLADHHLDSLGRVRSATGQEMHGFNVPPAFEDAAAGNYRLAAASPLVDKGVPIPGINDGYAGRAPDIGAFESDHGTGASLGLPHALPFVFRRYACSSPAAR
jgi:hypothetical protein